MDHLLVDCQWKAAVDLAGSLDGYISTFGNIDQGGDVVMPGAFRKTFSDWSRARSPMPLIADHNLSTDGVIGSVTKMTEDAHGARIRARFSSVPKAQEIRQKMLEGHLSGMSFTYQPVKFHFGQQDGRDVRFLDELRVLEATVTPFPMNTLATASAKAVEAPEALDMLDDAIVHIAGVRDPSLRKHLLAQAIQYHPAAGAVDEPPTAPEAVDTPAVDTSEAASYAVNLLPHSEPRDDALSVLLAHQSGVIDADIDRLEAEITRQLGDET